MMKKLGICLFAALCAVLSGCAGAQREIREEAPPEQPEARQEAQDGTAAEPTREEPPEPSGKVVPAAEDGGFTGRWQAVENPECGLDIRGREEGGYTIEITCPGGQGTAVWQAEGAYDETWEGLAYMGTKYEELVKEDGSVERIPAPEREEVTGMVYLEEDGALLWIDDFDHAGEGLRFERASP